MKMNFTSVLFFVASFFASIASFGQVQINSNLTGGGDLCLNRGKTLIISVKQGTCNPFAGDINSVSFVWQIETSPNVWADITSYPIQGISYSATKVFNTTQTQITARLIVTNDWTAPEGTHNYRVLVQGSGGCPVATSINQAIVLKPNTWIGGTSSNWDDATNWSCGRVPSTTERAVVSSGTNPCVLSVARTVKALEIATGGVFSVNSGINLTVNGPVNVIGSGDFTLKNNANLLQAYKGVNSGNIKVERNSSALMRLDYTLWGSPVTGQNLLNFSPLTQTSPTNRFYIYNTNTNVYASINPTTNSFALGKGYLIRMPNNHPTTATIWKGVFTGVPNNGDITLNLTNGGVGQRTNAIGNPYPSPVKMSNFVSGNTSNITGTLYFWRKSNSTVTDPGYCTWTNAGFVSNGEAQVFNPNGIIRTGQGFLVELLNNATTVVFNNSMRIGNNADQFFRTSSEFAQETNLSGDKIKLNVSNLTSGYKNQMLLGYFEKATLGVDYGIDGKSIENHPVVLSTVIDNQEYLIQGRPSFTNDDVVSLRFKTETAGEFGISTEELVGVFQGDQQVYLKDKFLNKLHDIKASEYRFTSDAGTFDDRFELVYQNKNISNSNALENSLVIYKKNSSLVIESTKELSNVKVYDVRGRVLAQSNNLTSLLTVVELNVTNEIIFVHVTTNDGVTTSKKIVF
ncbi:hypothetical protein LZZ90_03565 [Flavobacterium sp. SM15]|uniref:hypothetical protein n=1 Tax=Flavobacterium sp. SM15 TaxID=2908005 RepID=UPI001EDB5F6E|nr:hypothetical protein [Flavobacterium sp. SM15]MCG2610583.1 hypothetical protein [Flavobacterium sp. SM15]